MFGSGKRREPESEVWQDESAWEDNADVHTPGRPYCGDLSCWCHTNVAYHDQVTGSFSTVTEDEIEEAYSFFGVQRQ